MVHICSVKARDAGKIALEPGNAGYSEFACVSWLATLDTQPALPKVEMANTMQAGIFHHDYRTRSASKYPGLREIGEYG